VTCGYLISTARNPHKYWALYVFDRGQTKQKPTRGYPYLQPDKFDFLSYSGRDGYLETRNVLIGVENEYDLIHVLPVPIHPIVGIAHLPFRQDQLAP